MIDLGIVGLASYYGPAYAASAGDRPDVNVAGVVPGSASESDLESLSRPTPEGFAETHDCPIFDDVTALIGGADLDAAIVATRLDRRADDAIALIDSGHAVLTAKPTADSPADADRIAAAAHDADVVTTTTSPMRFDQTIGSVAARVEAGDIGDVLRVEVSIQHNPFLERGIEANPESAPDQAGTAYSIGYYGADGLLWLANASPDRVYAEYANLNTPYLPHPDIGVATIAFDDGTIGSMSMTVSTRIREYQQWEIEVVGTEGILTTDRTGYSAYFWDENATSPMAFGRTVSPVLDRQLEAFLEAVAAGDGPEAIDPTPSTAASGIAVCAAWERAAERSEPVSLDT